jgi:hypothetical protein
MPTLQPVVAVRRTWRVGRHRPGRQRDLADRHGEPTTRELGDQGLDEQPPSRAGRCGHDLPVHPVLGDRLLPARSQGAHGGREVERPPDAAARRAGHADDTDDFEATVDVVLDVTHHCPRQRSVAHPQVKPTQCRQGVTRPGGVGVTDQP